MLDEDVLIKTTRNTNESVLVWNVIIAVLLPVIFFGGGSELFMGLFISLGMVAPINIINYQYAWNPQPARQILYMFLYTLPFVAMFVITLLGVNNGGLEEYELGGYTYFALSDVDKYSIFCINNSPLESISADLATISAFLCGLSIYMITDSRYVIRKILVWIAVLSAVVMIVGCGMIFMWNFEGSIFADSTGDFFSTFPCSAHWASFAILWIGASLAMGIFSEQRFRSFTFFYSMRFACLASAFVLYCGVLVAGKPVHVLCANILFGVSFCMLAFDMLPIKANMYKHEMLLHMQSHTKRLQKMQLPFLGYLLVAGLFVYLSVMSIVSATKNPVSLVVDEGNSNSITYVEKMSVIEDTYEMLSNEHSVFGYGAESFANVFSLFQGSDLGALPWKSPNSDILHEYVEKGIVGLILVSITFVFFLIKWLFKFSFSKSGIVLFLTLMSILGMSIIEIPLQNIAVIISFWVIAMSLFRWDDAKVK